MTDETTYIFNVQNMKCGGCVSTVEKALEACPGVISYEVSLENQSANVVAQTDAETIAEAITASGFPASIK